jgi:SAM-dependent methyltransferase
MQNRHLDRRSYFNELATTSEEYYIPYLEKHTALRRGMQVLEIGCGEGGNLEPFAERGCRVTGVDIVEERTEQARTFFAQDGVEGTFVCNDAIKCGEEFRGRYDIVLAHDVIEHVGDKAGFLSAAYSFLRPGGVAFFGFPAWQMPFGGHQQICRSKFCSHAPFIHLLPTPFYRLLLETCEVKEKDVIELMDIKSTRTTIEMFEKTALQAGFTVENRHLWFINPHYKAKFGLTPRTLCKPVAAIPWLRNFFTTSAFYLLKKEA